MNENKANYDKLMQGQLKDSIGKKLLLHACCAPCASYPIELLSSILDITLYFYNPNICDIDEYQKRFDEFKKLPYNLKIIDANFTPDEFNQIVKGKETEKEGGKRCFDCYSLRLNQTAKYAKENNYDFFGTVLSVSPYKNSAYLNSLGKQFEEKYKITFLYSDFKKREGYKKSCQLSKKYGLYRQNFCGCSFSKQ